MFHSVRALGKRVTSFHATAHPAASSDEGVPDCPPENVRPQVDIPIRSMSPDAAEQGRIRIQGRYLARQDDWETLSCGLRQADEDRAATLGGTPVARLLGEGAGSDAVDSACGAVSRNDPTAARAILYSLRDCMDRSEEDAWLAHTLALAHLAVARAWEGPSGAGTTPEFGALRHDARAQHLEIAHRLISRFDPIECNSAAIAALRCALVEVDARPACRVIDDYEDLIDLDPACADHMRALGRDLVPSRFGSWEKLDREARRTAARVSDVWGMGGYSWVWFDALCSGETRGFAYVEAELFVEGLHDILARRPDQHMANTLAAYCGQSLSGAASSRAPRARIADSFGWIVQDHLREIHPDIWARAQPNPSAPDTAGIQRAGGTRALSALRGHFAHQLERGRTVRFTEAGVALEPTPCVPCVPCALAPCAGLTYPRRDQRDEDTACLT
ncbi:hypothetical protein [Salipiger aestuarii]|uniref:hypothetical protein n=1 Tax=Salipiger aestuarii TaxID=568098 RepID=UPI0016814796|nr:hypothetical protein [Salipiger aestuarii]